MNLGIGLGLSFVRPSGAAAFSPASLPLTLWVEDYAGLPWVGEASAGTSGAHSLTAGTAPGVGTAFNGHDTAYFNAGSKNIDGGGGLTWGDLISASAFTIHVIANFDSAIAPAGGGRPDLDHTVAASINANLYITQTTDGIAGGYYDGSGYKVTTAIAHPANGTKACIQMKLVGGTIKVRVNGSGWQTTSAANVRAAELASGVRFGLLLDGREAQIIAADTALSDADLDSLYADAQSRFGVP
jgi:hypothetical protein